MGNKDDVFDLLFFLKRRGKKNTNKQKADELVKQKTEKEEQKIRETWNRLPEKEKERYIQAAATKSKWLQNILLRGEKDQHEDMVKGMAIIETKVDTK